MDKQEQDLMQEEEVQRQMRKAWIIGQLIQAELDADAPEIVIKRAAAKMREMLKVFDW